MARRFLLIPNVGERLLASKLQILSGTGARRPSLALSILTGQTPAPAAATPNEPAPEVPVTRARRQFAARTVYLSEEHLRDIDHIIDAWQEVAPRRLNRSAILRRAVEHLRAAVEADPAATSLLESE